MKSYKEYYKLFKKEEQTWILNQKEEWWKEKPFNEDFKLSGDYIETVQPLDETEKNDVSLFKNHTNIRNSEWSILFSMLGQALIDWCVENADWEKIWAFSITIDRIFDGQTDFYSCKHKMKRMCDNQMWEHVSDDTLKDFEGCRDFLCDLFNEFIQSHGNDIPLDWNYFCFSLDSLNTSCQYGTWVCDSDGYMTLGNASNDWDEFVLSM